MKVKNSMMKRKGVMEMKGEREGERRRKGREIVISVERVKPRSNRLTDGQQYVVREDKHNYDEDSDVITRVGQV